LPDGLSDADYAAKFLAEFGATLEQPAIYRDVVGEPLVMSGDMFRPHGADSGYAKATKRDRNRYMLMLADAVKEPDEIWMHWVGREGNWKLHRRYIGVFQITGEPQPALAVFEEGTDGWLGETIYQVSKKSDRLAKDYINSKRGGFLAYRRNSP
jgi:hypothetical protein